MAEARIIRRTRFQARHFYRRSEWSESRNREVFGAQSEPHGHDWVVELRLVGPIDPETGFSIELDLVDGLLADVVAGWDGGDLNLLLPGIAVPTTEAVAQFIFDSLVDRVPLPARLECAAVFESPDLGAEYPAGPFDQ